ncbi:Protein CBG06717 [Caenorhabditis briggsae]|uniref:Protein CBG06717 n=2 Tax=Caenorhabditis briggsae TaxID=6238 RepID=A8X2X8_CAEBR|nr:Protein CBG06717 [Caenorhabditis briggsae]ULT88290.1 hypothetical protein L3Y34_007468 [Caenorhabditis briggsae]CAP26988.1 Protein CBG06717 [Caenorhabditis briggsae]
MLSFYPAITLFSLVSMTSATGHLRLELTSSEHCTLHLKTSSSFQALRLNMGITRIVSFHPKVNQKTIEIAFFKGGSPPQSYVYEMETSNGTSYQTFIFSQTVILVQSFFECDSGFYGYHCNDRTTSTSTTSSTTTPVSPATSGTTKVKVVTETSPGRSMAPISTNTFLCGSLMIVIVILLALICTICILIRSSHQNIYIQPQAPTPIKTKCKITIEDSECYSPESVRYTAAPFKSVTISL